MWVSFFPVRLCRSTVPDLHLFTVDGLNCALPAGQSFFETDFYSVSNVISVACEKRICFLWWCQLL